MRISDWSSDVCSSDLNIPMSEKSDKGLRRASVHLIGMLVANGEDEDLVWAWVWIAAAMGEQFAGLALAGRLLREASDIGCRDRSRYRRLARAATFPNFFGNTALEDLIDTKSLDNRSEERRVGKGCVRR